MTEQLYSGGGFVVTASTLRTPKQSYDLKNIEYISVRQPLLILAALLAFGLIVFALSFWRYLYPVEIIGLIAVPLLAVALARRIGTLKVHSLAMQGGGESNLFGMITHLRKVKEAVETAMDGRLQ